MDALEGMDKEKRARGSSHDDNMVLLRIGTGARHSAVTANIINFIFILARRRRRMLALTTVNCTLRQLGKRKIGRSERSLKDFTPL